MIGDNYIPTKTLANGSTTVFSFGFEIGASTNLRVYSEDYVTGAQTLLTTGFTIAFNDQTPGGTVTFSSAPGDPTPEDSVYIVIGREYPRTQSVAYKTAAGFKGSVIERSFDKISALLQESIEAVGRAIKLPLGSSLSDVVLPNPSAGKALVGNSGEDGWENSDVDLTDLADSVDAVDDAVTAAQAAQAAAEVAQIAAEAAVTALSYASQAEAEAGTVENKMMNPLRTSQAIAALIGDHVDGTTIEESAGDLRVKDAAISTAKLKTTTGEVSATGSHVNNTLPGGTYGFYPQTKTNDGSGNVYVAVLGIYGAVGAATPTSYSTRISMVHNSGGTVYALQRYVTASGKDHWLFLLIERSSGNIIGGYSAPDHPCYGNGDDPNALQQPFNNYDPELHDIVVVDKATIAEAKQIALTKNSLLQVILEDYELADEAVFEPLHVGTFNEDGSPVMLRELPSFIKCRSMLLRTQ